MGIVAKNFSIFLKSRIGDDQNAQLALANRFDYNERTIKNWMKCKRFPREKILESIADFFGVHVSEMFGFSDPESAKQPVQPAIDDARMDEISKLKCEISKINTEKERLWAASEETRSDKDRIIGMLTRDVADFEKQIKSLKETISALKQKIESCGSKESAEATRLRQ